MATGLALEKQSSRSHTPLSAMRIREAHPSARTPLAWKHDASGNAFYLFVPEVGRVRFSPEASLGGAPVGRLFWTCTRTTSQAETFTANNPIGTWTLKIRKDKKGGLSLQMQARLHEPRCELQLTPLRLQRYRADHFLLQGRSMGGCSSHIPSEVKDGADFRGAFLASLTRNGVTLQIAHPLAQTHLSEFSGRIEKGAVKFLTASTSVESKPRSVFYSEPVTLSLSTDGHQLMREWTAVQAGEREPLSVPQESGWNSWDYYRWTISEEEVMKNAEFIASDSVLSRHIKRIIIDDGWQHCYGEWEGNFRFPSGMAKIARQLDRMGFTPGLWFAPTIIEPHARIAQLHPEMMACGLSGLPCLAFSCMERKGLILDPTSRAVKSWWQELFARYASWGFRYFKLDFLAHTFLAPQFGDSAVAKGHLMRHILGSIRDAVGPECRLLGCNLPFDRPRGHADDIRISSDIHANWDAVKKNVISIAARFWAHQRIGVSDADFALCRGDQTSHDPHLHQLKPLLVYVQPEQTGLDRQLYGSSLVSMTASEAEVLLSLVIASGGAVNLSDNLPRLNTIGLELARKTVTAEKGAAAIPVDLFQSILPAIWQQKLSSGTQRLLLINWEDTPTEKTIDLTALDISAPRAKNFWTDETIALSGRWFSPILAPHSCLLVEWK